MALVLWILATALVNGVLVSLLIRVFTRRSVTQTIREQGPESHQAKSRTPTMGGIAFMVSLPLALVGAMIADRFLLGSSLGAESWVLAFLSLGFALAAGAVGLADDLVKARGDAAGLKARYRIVFQVILGLLLGWVCLKQGLSLVRYGFSDAAVLDLGWGIVPLTVLVFVGALNAVNFTDGLDGLLAGTAGGYGLFFAAALSALGASAKLSGSGGVGLAALGLMAVCASFLWFNAHPARIFMGDAGSMFIGGLIGALACVTGLQLFLFAAGFVFVAEALSVMLQVAWFRLGGRRIFRMAPLHHHFELAGWEETTVVVRFWLASACFGLLALGIFISL